MKLIDLIRLLRKHIILLLISPILLAGLVAFLTKNPVFKYISETSLYTGIASGSSVEMDKSTNYFATNTAFDNLINIIKSRKTEEEVGIRLLCQHLLLDKSDPKFISEKSYSELKRITPDYIEQIVEKIKNNAVKQNSSVVVIPETSARIDSLLENASFSFNTINALNAPSSLPPSINPAVYEQTVKSLTDYMMSSDTNFVYRLLNFEDPHYSIKAISTINVQRVGTSDLVKLKYESDDPGICRQTLALLTEVCITNYKSIKENRSDAVVKYFEFQLKQAATRLKIAEDKLLEFNKDNNIINYYEQSKAVAVVKEDLDVEYNNKRIKLAGIQAVIKRLEEKLAVQDQIQLKSTSIIEKRNQLGELNYKINSAETTGIGNNAVNTNLNELKSQADNLKNEIRSNVSELYSYSNSTEGLPVNTILNDWINNVIEAENLKAGIEVLGERIKEFQKQYAVYAPAGANIKRIEREISVSEKEFLEILHGLGLAKLKLQDNELSSNIKAVDAPFFPISPVPTKRKILIIVAAMLGFMIVLTTIFVLEFFDSSLKKPTKASAILKLDNLGVLPKILLNFSKLNFQSLIGRLLEITCQNIEMQLKVSKTDNAAKMILFFSTLEQEGKSVVMGNLAQKFKSQGKKVLVLNYVSQSYIQSDVTSIESKRKERLPVIRLLLGYPDNRIDHESPFLRQTNENLNKTEYLNYQINEDFYTAKDYRDILSLNNFQISFIPDYVLIELPSILYHSYPIGLVSNADLPILICRSNRVWTDADQGVLDVLMKLTTQKTQFILNGVEPLVMESILGDLPRKRSWLRRTLKKMVRFQFLTSNHI
jgi:uncharacterized protein involved in exopolysaccharide biosynthesis